MFGARLPIIQAPMLGASGPLMAREASRAGALGSLALAGTAPAGIGPAIAALKAELGETPFAVNLFAIAPAAPDRAMLQAAMQRLAPYRAEFGLPEQTIPNSWAEDFAGQLAGLVEAAPPAASFTFGILTRAQADALKARGTLIIGTATTLAEAKAWEEVGADAVVAQGMEAGGHRGTFLAPVEQSLVGTLSLVSACKAALRIPVVAAGGISDGRAVAAALTLGADSVQVGTAFLLSDESLISAPWKAALNGQSPEATALTRAFSGRHARGLINRFMRDMADEDIPPYPIQNALTQELRAAAAKAGRDDMLSLWAGQSVHAIRPGKTGEIIAALWAEAQAALKTSFNRYHEQGKDTP